MSQQGVTRVVLAGAHGHGRWHLSNIRTLAEHAEVRLAGVCDPHPLTAELRELAGPVPVSGSLQHLLESTQPDVTIICTPIHSHVGLALEAMDAGSHVLLEKPPAATLADYLRLRRGTETTGRVCQIGFQSLGSQTLPAVRRMVAEGVIGEVRGIGGTGVWVRDATYYERAPWAGRRHIDGIPVVDGALTNPFAHSIASALSLDGSEGPGDLTRVETDLYHANPIEADDTSSIRLTTRRGTTIAVAVTLCAEHSQSPYLRVHGTRGRIRVRYKEDEVRVETAGACETTVYPRTDLLANLVAHLRDGATPLLVPPERVHAFMEVMEAIRTGPEPAPIPGEHQKIDEAARRRTVVGIDHATEAAADRLLLFRELALPWTSVGAVPR